MRQFINCPYTSNLFITKATNHLNLLSYLRIEPIVFLAEVSVIVVEPISNRFCAPASDSNADVLVLCFHW